MEPVIIQPVMKIPWESIPVLAWAQRQERATVELIGQMVRIESPSDDPAALGRFADWFGELVSRQYGAAVERLPGGHLVCHFGSADAPAAVMVLGHYDTVWPIGTLEGMPFREADGRLWGPGVLDMKGGLAIFLTAMRGLRELNVPLGARVVLQVNADEETGSQSSRAFTESNARQSQAVLVVEPGTGLTGKLKTARKGVGDYRIHVTGRAAHSGVDFSAGASAILELSRQLLAIAEFTDVERGITVNPGIVSGGTRPNVVAAEAQATVDIRAARLVDATHLDAKFRALRPIDARCAVSVEGGLNRPPMERSDAIGALYGRARALGRVIGIDVEESATGGGSDGNFTAALGIPTLDGIGVVGEGAHAAHESILVNRLADRIALLAMVIAELNASD